MKLFLQVIFLIIIISVETVAQEVDFYGEFKPGSLIIGKAEDVKDVWLDKKRIQVDDSGFFVFGFDRDDKGTHLLKVKFNDEKVYLKKIVLQEREYKIQKINRMKQKYVKPPKEQLERISKERKIIKGARKTIGKIDSALYVSGFIRPVKGGRQTSVFGSQRILNGVPKNAHNGLDIAAARGTSVFAMADGVVRLAGNNFFYNGNFVLLDHGQGLSSIYLHLKRKFVKDGDKVRKGQKIGEVGTTGRSTGPHLHWGVQWFGVRVDPALLLDIKLN